MFPEHYTESSMTPFLVLDKFANSFITNHIRNHEHQEPPATTNKHE